MASSARIEELERKFNENPRRYFAPLANEYRKAGDLTQAISICRTYVPQQPGHMSGHIVFGQALFEAGEFEEAQGVFTSALQLDPENLIALRHLGDIARERGEITSAREWYRRVLDADPRNEEIAAQLGTLNGLSDAPPRNSVPTGIDAAATDGLSGWHEINPEKTLELPASLVEAAMRMSEWSESPAPAAPAQPEPARAEVAAPATEPVAPAAPPPPEPSAPHRQSLDVDLTAFDGFFTGDEPMSTPPATPAAPAETTTHNDLGLEVMEFVPPPRAPVGAAPPVVGSPADAPSAFVTETMAELYLQQGFHDEALQVYRQLLAQTPDDAMLRERVAQLESGSQSSVGMAAGVSASVIEAANQRRNAPTVRSVRAFFGDLASRRVVVHGADAPPSYYHHEEPPTEAASEPPAASPAPAPPPQESMTEAPSALSTPASLPAPASPASPSTLSAPYAPPGDSYALESHDSASSYSDTAFGGDEYGADAFAGGLVGLGGSTSGRDDLDPEYGGDGLVSRRAEDVDEFGLPKNTSEPGAFGFTDDSGPPVAPQAPQGQGGSVNGLFPDSHVAPRDEAAASALSGAFPPAEPSAARRASTELSLDSVFREAPEGGAGSPTNRRESSAFSFDQFFGQETVGGMTSGDGTAASNDRPADPSPNESGGAGGHDNDPAETEQFSSWLSGLKKK